MEDKKQIEKIKTILIKPYKRTRTPQEDYINNQQAELIYKYIKKLLKDSVVLTREEYEKGKQDYNYQIHRALVAEGRVEQSRKETVREILNKVDTESNGQTKQITDLLRKQVGVEVE